MVISSLPSHLFRVVTRMSFTEEQRSEHEERVSLLDVSFVETVEPFTTCGRRPWSGSDASLRPLDDEHLMFFRKLNHQVFFLTLYLGE